MGAKFFFLKQIWKMYQQINLITAMLSPLIFCCRIVQEKCSLTESYQEDSWNLQKLGRCPCNNEHSGHIISENIS